MQPQCTLQVRVRYSECDPMGLLHHSRYPVFFEMARTELLRLAGIRYRDLESLGVFVVVARLEVRYRMPARYDDELTIHARVSRVTAARIEHAYEVRRGADLIAEATTTVACVDKAGQLTHLPREQLGLPAE